MVIRGTEWRGENHERPGTAWEASAGGRLDCSSMAPFRAPSAFAQAVLHGLQGIQLHPLPPLGQMAQGALCKGNAAAAARLCRARGSSRPVVAALVLLLSAVVDRLS